MSDRLRLLLDQSRTVDHGALLAEKRTALGLSIDDVADRLLLSRSQVRGLESNSVAAFYSQRFFERANATYAAFLDSRRAENQLTNDDHVTLRIELASSPSAGTESAT
jgi:transcriptional regulator with XRE-family HTH domain